MRRFILAIGLVGSMCSAAVAGEIPADQIPPEKISDSPHCWTVWVCDAWDSQGNCTHGHDEKQCQ